MQLLWGRPLAFRTALTVLPKRHNTISAVQDGSSPDARSGTEEDVLDPFKAAVRELTAAGFDPASFWEQRIVWGDQDAFQHVNNVRYMRFFESSRMKWVLSIGRELGGQAKAEAMVKGHGVSLILKSIEVRFRRPVTFPDTLLIGYRPKIDSDPGVLNVTASAYSVAQQTVVATSNEALVWYDYDRLKKHAPGEETLSVVLGRVRSWS